MMNKTDYLGAYAAGWTKGDVDAILAVTTESFVFDDPNAGKIARADLAEYVAGMQDAVAGMRGADFDGPLLNIYEVLTQEDENGLTASCWWDVPGTDMQGSGLIKISNDGVESERLAYYTKLPE